jgi:acetoin utilization protein AcuB
MRISDIMTKNVFTTPPALDADDALARMRRRRVHHLVVADGGQIVGIVSERDLGGPRGASVRRGQTVANLMTANTVTATPETTVRQAANLMRGRGIGCLPVLEDGALVGIVTTTDLLDLIGRGAERPVTESKRWTLARRGATRRATASARAGSRRSGPRR